MGFTHPELSTPCCWQPLARPSARLRLVSGAASGHLSGWVRPWTIRRWGQALHQLPLLTGVEQPWDGCPFPACWLTVGFTVLFGARSYFSVREVPLGRISSTTGLRTHVKCRALKAALGPCS